MAKPDTYKSAAPLTLVKDSEGRYLHVYKGAPVPASADPDDVKRLLKEGYLEADMPATAKTSTGSRASGSRSSRSTKPADTNSPADEGPVAPTGTPDAAAAAQP